MAARETTFELREKQVWRLERNGSEFRNRNVGPVRPGELINQSTFYWGTLTGRFSMSAST